MKIIDRETKQRILDAADIVEVVSDFVTLKRRGSSYMGLCPFHNERTPSFSVSKSKNICKCFSCGKGGSPVNFIMELEQMTYNEALRYLAKKYNIEIKERELTDKEREEESDRESMWAVNDFAMRHFEHNLTETPDGRQIGLAYFMERGISEAMIKKFHLGYAMERSTDLAEAARNKGYKDKYLIETGLCILTDRGTVYDRFKGRVIYPVHTVSGRVVAFGGRTLKKDVAKYVNSPESKIYSKSNQLYGLFQAKHAIGRQNKCILVEGYMDVISMHQAGVENVVASSGTSLTDGQIRAIHKFTDNITIIYDGDSAGIKAALRGIDLLLAEGMNVKVVLLPDGHDPDSFAQSRNATAVQEYIAAHEVDIVRFKTDILLHEAGSDPMTRSKVVTDIIRTIAVIPDPVSRAMYIQEVSRSFEISEQMVSRQVAAQAAAIAETNARVDAREAARRSLEEPKQEPSPADTAHEDTAQTSAPVLHRDAPFLRPYEAGVLRYALRYGVMTLYEDVDDAGNPLPVSVLDYIAGELETDELSFLNPDLSHAYMEAQALAGNWREEEGALRKRLLERRAEMINEGQRRLIETGADIATITRKEKEITEEADEAYHEGLRQAASAYIVRELSSHPDDGVRRITVELASDRHTLSKVHTKFQKIETEQERLPDLVPRAIYEYKDAVLECSMRDLHRRIREVDSSAPDATAQITALFNELAGLQRIRAEFAKFLGERIVYPKL